MSKLLVPFNFDQLGEPREYRPPAERVIEGVVVCRNWNIDSAALSDAAFVLAHIKVSLAFALSTVNHLGCLAADTCCQEVGLANPATAAKESPA